MWKRYFGSRHPDRYSQYYDLSNNLFDNLYSLLDAVRNNIGFQPVVLEKMVELQNASADLINFHQDMITGPEKGWNFNPVKYFLLHAIITEIIWLMILPYVLRWSIVPIVHRIFSERSRTN